MGLTSNSTGKNAIDCGLDLEKQNISDKIIALAGNPNVGKSTVFNALTGLNQHTGNWPGKTVSNASGIHKFNNINYIMVDLPGTYSLMANSAEEEVARDFICFGSADSVIVVCDATCLERNLNLVLQTIEITGKTIVCVNLMDEAKKKHIEIDLNRLETLLGVPVVAAIARNKNGLDDLMTRISGIEANKTKPIKIHYNKSIETAIALLISPISEILDNKINSRWVALKLLDADESLLKSMNCFLQFDILKIPAVSKALKKAQDILNENQITNIIFKKQTVSSIVETAEIISNSVVSISKQKSQFDRKLDRVLTNKITGIPIMLALLCVVFWITITGANYPSELLSAGLFWIEDRLVDFFMWIGTPSWIYGVLVQGIYRVLAWVISVMLPPMAIFFPLFTILEDFGYLPRVAFNLDHHFKKACACGKQSLTMCMG